MKVLITLAILASFFFYFLILSVSSEHFRPAWKATWFRTFVYAQTCFEYDDYPFPAAPRKIMLHCQAGLRREKEMIRPRGGLIDLRPTVLVIGSRITCGQWQRGVSELM
jgi:hypothetical protein